MNKDSIIKILSQVYNVTASGAEVASASTTEFLSQVYNVTASNINVSGKVMVQGLGKVLDTTLSCIQTTSSAIITTGVPILKGFGVSMVPNNSNFDGGALGIGFKSVLSRSYGGNVDLMYSNLKLLSDTSINYLNKNYDKEISTIKEVGLSIVSRSPGENVDMAVSAIKEVSLSIINRPVSENINVVVSNLAKIASFVNTEEDIIFDSVSNENTDICISGAQQGESDQ